MPPPKPLLWPNWILKASQSDDRTAGNGEYLVGAAAVQNNAWGGAEDGRLRVVVKGECAAEIDGLRRVLPAGAEDGRIEGDNRARLTIGGIDGVGQRTGPGCVGVGDDDLIALVGTEGGRGRADYSLNVSGQIAGGLIVAPIEARGRRAQVQVAGVPAAVGAGGADELGVGGEVVAAVGDAIFAEIVADVAVGGRHAAAAKNDFGTAVPHVGGVVVPEDAVGQRLISLSEEGRRPRLLCYIRRSGRLPLLPLNVQPVSVT